MSSSIPSCLLSAPLLLILLIAGGGCAPRPMSSPAGTAHDLVRNMLEPMELGMPRTRVAELFPDYKKLGVIVTPSQAEPGGEIVLANGVSVSFALDENDRVFYLAVDDPRIRLSGDVGVGTTFKEAKARFAKRRIAVLPGYGTLVNVCPNGWLAFWGETGDLPSDDTKARWIEFRSDLNCWRLTLEEVEASEPRVSSHPATHPAPREQEQDAASPK